MYVLVHKRMSIYNLRRFDYNLQSFNESSFDTDLFIFVTAIHLLVIEHIMEILFFNEIAVIIVKWSFLTCFRVQNINLKYQGCVTEVLANIFPYKV